jgi:pSer/pThr/pTyr-binding forkhead associated (FHA) protein
MFGELVPQGGGDPVPLLQKKLLVGRRDSCDIALRFPNVSSRHCEMEFVDGYWMVRDLGSSNGTKVNGVRVRAKWVLPGDELSIAKHRFKIDYNVAADAPPPPPLNDEEDLGTSLLEKAGLMRRRSQQPPTSRRDNESKANGQTRDPASAEEKALEWLAEDDDL